MPGVEPGVAAPAGFLRSPIPRGTLVRLGAFWFLYFAGLGVFFPYYGLYLRENAALDGSQVGLVLAVIPLVGSLAQFGWGYLADRTGERTRVLAAVAAGAACGYAGLGAVGGFPALLLATAALALFSTAIVPVGISVSLAALRDAGPHAFGFARAGGTVGFLALVVVFPWALHRMQDVRRLPAAPGGPSEPGLGIMFVATAILVLAAALVAARLPRAAAVGWRAPRGHWRELARRPAVVRLCVFAFLAYACLQGPMGIFPIYVRALGGDLNAVGRMWVIMLVVEIPLVLLSGTGLVRLGPRALLAIGVIAAGVRWIVCGLARDLDVVYPMQLLHGVTVVGLLLGAPLYLDAVAPERLRSTGQTVLAMVGIGWGGSASNAVAGWLLEHVGPGAPYLVGGIGGLVLGCLVPVLLPRPARRPAGDVGGGYVALEV
jgi:PPP family 3-phenylpropionic acid transporter